MRRFAPLLMSIIALSGCYPSDLSRSVERLATVMENSANAEIELRRSIAIAECIQRGLSTYSSSMKTTVRNQGDAQMAFSMSIVPCKAISVSLMRELMDGVQNTTKGEVAK